MTRVSCSVDGAVVTIAMDDGKANALGPEMQRELHAALDRAERDGLGVVLAGREGRFSGGFDLAVVRAGGVEAVDMFRGGFELAARMLSFPTPVVIACTGHAMAMGAFLLLTGDHRVGADGAFKIAANEVAIGLTMPYSGLAIIRGRLTPADFDRAVATAAVYAPDAAVRAGFLDELVAPDRVVTTAQAIAASLMTLDMPAHAASKLRARAATLDAIRAGIEAEFPAVPA
jgi:enoyl-CoA hydratase